MIYRIHQIKDIGNTIYAFRSFDPGRFNFADYECTYDAEIEIEDRTETEICDIIFYVFNMRRPADFEGHSLSVSDIIELKKYGSSQFYYCNSCGFVKLNKKDLKIK